MARSGEVSESTGAAALSFFGKFRQKVDAKGRLTLPAIHRRALEASGDEWLVLRQGDEGFMQIIPSLQWQQTLAARRRIDAAEKGGPGRDRSWDRRLEATEVAVVPMDLKGRITVSQDHLSFAGIDRDALVLGVGGHLELWDRKRYEAAAKGHSVDRGSIDDQLYG